MQTFLAAAVQTRATADAEASIERAVGLVDRAIAAGARLIVLPEGFAGLGDAASRRRWAFDPADPGGSPALSPLCARSRAHPVVIVAGGIPERSPDLARPFNTLVLVAGGRALARYRKVHLFDANVPGAPRDGESAATSPGDRVCVFDTPLGRLGPSICYDLRFPALYAAQAALGAEVLLVPSAFTLRTGLAHWEPLLRARAIENGAWVIAAAQHGEHGGGRESHGHAMIVDPWGTVVAQASGGDDVVLARLCSDRLEEVRRAMPSLQHRVEATTRPVEVTTITEPEALR